MDFLGGWSSKLFREWNVARTEIDVEFDHYAGSGYACSNISSKANQNLSTAQKELLLWHWKSGISMQQIQELMRVVEVKEPNGAVSTMPCVITPKIKSAAYCPIQLCHTSNIFFIRMFIRKFCYKQNRSTFFKPPVHKLYSIPM